MNNMKRIIIICSLLICAATTHAQIIETFDSNTFGWIESVEKDGSAIIVEGVMRLEGKNALNDTWLLKPGISQVMTSCYAPFDPQKNFTFKCDAIAKKISDKGFFGLVFDYMDNYNYSAFYICKGDKNAKVLYERVERGELIGRRTVDLKLKQKKNATFAFELKSAFDRLEFYCNGMKAIEVRYNPIDYCGVGFVVYGQQTIDFDNVQFIQ